MVNFILSDCTPDIKGFYKNVLSQYNCPHGEDRGFCSTPKIPSGRIPERSPRAVGAGRGRCIPPAVGRHSRLSYVGPDPVMSCRLYEKAYGDENRHRNGRLESRSKSTTKSGLALRARSKVGVDEIDIHDIGQAARTLMPMPNNLV
ncbi:hypothetical protein EVAR_53985_1 [Eumeta japonica]|uniref:Uncharacterized protein n=1 Tax=Eumeta variegata TaxID=151549 RepID=A0A4C1YSN0_EUMVA|nr:hypothetical protein EVAR_53985_1 [Eumeta japonica]